MKHIIITLVIISMSSMLFGQSITYELPIQDFDSLNVNKCVINIDTTTKTVEIIESRFSKVNVRYNHYRYQTTLDAIDTIAIMVDDAREKMGMRILLCDGLKFKVDDPYKGKRIPYFISRKRLTLQHWSVEKHYDLLFGMTEAINRLIPEKEPCRAKRNLKMNKPLKSSSISYSNREKEIYSIRDEVTMASFMGSKSFDETNEYVHLHINECIGKVEGEYLLVLNYLIDEMGKVASVYFGCNCPDELKFSVSECMKETKWVPGRKGEQKVKISGSTLVGINIDDRYEELERRSKIVERRKPVIIPDDALSYGSSEFDENEVFKVVEDPPKLTNPSYFDELKKEISRSFPNLEYRETLKYIVEKDGSISDVKLVRSVNSEIGKLIVNKMNGARVYRSGKQRGRKVRVQTFKTLKNK